VCRLPAAPTAYTVYIGQKQWNKVADALQDPEDVLIVEGFPMATSQGISVYATNTSTKKLQQAQRAAQAPQA
jgi:molybdopterin-guanine dinucleotide biosynthesis protein